MLQEDVRGEIALLEEITRTARASQSPGRCNVTELVARGEENGQIFAVLEFAEQGELFSKMMDDTMDKRQAFLEVCQGMQFLHQDCRLAHRDMSLENVLVDGQGRAKICDFGLAVRADPTTIIVDGQYVGKSAYVCPQIARHEHYHPMAADIWSLAVMLIRLVFAQDLWDCSTFEYFRLLERYGSKRALRQLFVARNLPAEETLLDLLSNMLCIDESQRYDISQVLAHPWLTGR